MRKITKLKRSMRAISPVISVLLMIAIAVVAPLVAYAWVMGYIGSSTLRSGQAIQIQSVHFHDDGYVDQIYVQNVGQGQVNIIRDQSVYIEGIQLTPTSTSAVGNPATVPLDAGATLTINLPADNQNNIAGHTITIKVTAEGGTYSQISIVVPADVGDPVTPPDGNTYTTTTTLTAITTPLTLGQTNVDFSGSVASTPAVPNDRPVVLQYSTSPTGPWTNTATANTGSGSGAFSSTFTAPSTVGTYYFRAYFAAYTSGSDTWQTSTSAQQTITVSTAADPFGIDKTISARNNQAPNSDNIVRLSLGDTTYANEVLYLTVACSADVEVSSVTATGLDFQRRATAETGAIRVETWYAIKASAGATPQVSVAISGTTWYASAVLVSISGANTASPFDWATAQTNTGTGTAPSSGAKTTTNANDLLIGGVAIASTTTGSVQAGTNYVLVPNGVLAASASRLVAVESRIVTSTGSQTATFTGPNAAWAIVLDAIQKAP